MNSNAQLAALKGKVGYHEGPNNDNMFGPWQGVGNHLAWCDSFAQWGAVENGGYRWPTNCQCGVRGDAYTPYTVQHAQQLGIWRGRDTTGLIPGWQVLFDWNGNAQADHIGTVVQDNRDGTFVTVEGNEGDAVQYVKRDRTYVLGFVALPMDVQPPAPPPGPPPTPGAPPVSDFFAYPANFTGGVATAVGDIDGDGQLEVVTGAGPSGGPHVKLFKTDGTPLSAGFFAYDAGFTGGVNVAVGDVDEDGVDEIVTAPGPGGGPNVKVWKVHADHSVALAYSFNAYPSNFTGGVEVSAGKGYIVTGPGKGGGPDVRVFRHGAGPLS